MLVSAVSGLVGVLVGSAVSWIFMWFSSIGETYDRVTKAIQTETLGEVAEARHIVGSAYAQYEIDLAKRAKSGTTGKVPHPRYMDHLEDGGRDERAKARSALFKLYWSMTRINAVRVSIRSFHSGPNDLLVESLFDWVHWFCEIVTPPGGTGQSLSGFEEYLGVERKDYATESKRGGVVPLYGSEQSHGAWWDRRSALRTSRKEA